MLLFAVALAVRLIVVLVAARVDPGALDPVGDLDRVAWNLARGSGFTIDDGPVTRPTATVAPVVPWLVSLVYRSFGHRALLAVIFQCLFGALIPVLLGSLGASMFGASIGRVAGWLATLSPLLALSSHRLGSGIPLAATLLAALAASASWVKTPRPARALGVGLLFGLATLTHVTAALLPLLVAIWAWTPLSLTVAPGDRNRQIVLMAIGFVLVVAPWVVRNGVALRHPGLSTAVGLRFLDGNHPQAWSGTAARDETMAPAAPAPGGEAERDREAGARAWRFVRSRIREWPLVAIAKASRFWTGGRPSGARESAAPPALAGAIDRAITLWSFLVLPFALYGLARALASPRRWFQSLPAWVIVYLLAVAVVFFAAPVERLPAEPLALLFAAAGLEDVRRRIRTRGRGLSVIEGRR